MDTGATPSFPSQWRHLARIYHKFWAFRTGCVPWNDLTPLERKTLPAMAEFWDLTQIQLLRAQLTTR